MRLGKRVTLAVTGVTAIALLASFAAVSLLVSRNETADMDHALLMQAHAYAERAFSRHPEQPQVSEGLVAVPEALSAIPRYIAVYDQRGVPVSFSQNFRGILPPISSLDLTLPIAGAAEPFDLTAGRVHLRAVAIPMGTERRWSLLYAAARTGIDEDMDFLLRACSGIFVAAVLLTSLIAHWVSTRISRDVEAIAAVARTVAEGNLAARVGSEVHGTEETHSLAADMNEMISRLQALVVAHRTFVSHAAHELRSPLSTISGELQLALRRKRTADEYQSAIEGALEDVQSMTALAEDLLVLARVQHEQPAPARLDLVQVKDLLTETLRVVRGTAAQRGISIEVAFDAESTATLWLDGPLREISRALRNLLDNALAHSPEGGTVHIGARSTAEGVELYVVDQGSGVAVSERESLFEPFFRGAKEQGNERRGAGLGLAIAREIARKRGGDVRLAVPSPPQTGSRFELHLQARTPSS